MMKTCRMTGSSISSGFACTEKHARTFEIVVQLINQLFSANA